MEPKTVEMRQGPTFALLIGLVFAALAVHFFHFSPILNNVIVLGIALVMAGMVGAQYMGLKWEGRLVDGVVLVPLVLFAIIMLILLPDIGGFFIRL